MSSMEEPGAAYRRFMREVKAIREPYLSEAWLTEYRNALRFADLSDFAKLALLNFPLDPRYI